MIDRKGINRQQRNESSKMKQIDKNGINRQKWNELTKIVKINNKKRHRQSTIINTATKLLKVGKNQLYRNSHRNHKIIPNSTLRIPGQFK